MDIHLSNALGEVRVALGDAAQKATNRRLTVLQNRSPCKYGCNGCCSRLLAISLAEASLMVEHLRANNKWDDVRVRAQAQFRTIQETSPLAWFKMNIKCPVLTTEGACGAYSVRPAVCSTHFVTSDASACDPWSTKDVPYEQYDMMDLYDEFQKKLANSIGSFGVMQMTMPIPVALLVADRIQVKTSLSVPDLISLLYNEFK